VGWFIAYCYCIGSWLHSRHFQISQTTNVRGLFFVWRSVGDTKRYSNRPPSLYSTFEKNLSLTSPPKLRALSDALAPTLRSFRQKEYYEQPRFHASFAWVLLDRPTQPPPERSEPTLPVDTPLEDPSSENTNSFPTVPRLHENIIPALNAELDSHLKSTAGIFDVGEVRIRIGKDVFSWALSG
jgi:hypothetical protein